MKRLMILALIVSFWFGARAQAASSPSFVNLDQNDFEGIVNDFSGVYAYSSVSPASSLGKLFGFEVGLVGGGATTPRINQLVQDNEPSAKVSALPDTALLGAVSLPFGITGEVEVLPKESFLQNQVSDSSIAVAFKWTFTQLLEWPVDLAVKGYSKSAEATFSGVVGGVNTDFDFKDTITGLEFQVSKNFVVFEPYLTIGYLRGKGSMTVAGATNVFQMAYTSTSSASEVMISPEFNAGIDLNLVILKLGAEFGQSFHNTKATAKLSFYF